MDDGRELPTINTEIRIPHANGATTDALAVVSLTEAERPGVDSPPSPPLAEGER